MISDQQLQDGYERASAGLRLREERLAAGITQAELAWRSGITQGSLSNYETGKRDIPLPTLIVMCRVLRTHACVVVPALGPPECPRRPC